MNDLNSCQIEFKCFYHYLYHFCTYRRTINRASLCIYNQNNACANVEVKKLKLKELLEENKELWFTELKNGS